jgi:hypothetical protein
VFSICTDKADSSKFSVPNGQHVRRQRCYHAIDTQAFHTLCTKASYSSWTDLENHFRFGFTLQQSYQLPLPCLPHRTAKWPKMNSLQYVSSINSGFWAHFTKIKAKIMLQVVENKQGYCLPFALIHFRKLVGVHIFGILC